MVDTVVITLEWRKDFELMEGCYKQFATDVTNFFRPPFVQFGTKKAFLVERNPTAKEKASGNYMPRLTLIKAVRRGGVPITLNIEFSAQKVVHNDNFNEITQSDFDYLCVQLHRKLHNIGVIVTGPNTLKDALVSTIHYSKNIPLTDYSTAHAIITDLEKCNYTTHKKSDGQKYINNGEAMHFYSRKWGLCIYDKLKEHAKSKVTEKGLLEKDYYCQLSLFDEKPLANPFEMVRVEARYIGRPQIRKSFKDAGLQTDSLTFRDLFSETVAKKMLQYEIAKLRETYPAISLTDKTAPALLTELSIQNPRTQIGTIMEAVAYKTLLETTGSRDVRNIGNFTSQQWYNLNKKINSLNFARRKIASFDIIESQLQKFEPVKLQRYLDK
jgi:hypothetical protein